jgi:hypothetical protein
VGDATMNMKTSPNHYNQENSDWVRHMETHPKIKVMAMSIEIQTISSISTSTNLDQLLKNMQN